MATLKINLKHQFLAVPVVSVAVDMILNTTQFHLILLAKISEFFPIIYSLKINIFEICPCVNIHLEGTKAM